MSGVTPLLDTLLHQVLGKRMDAPESRSQTEPVRPLVPAEAARAVHSDSRLEGRQAVHETHTRASPQGERPPLSSSASPRAEASVSTHFSPAARAIAAALGQHPAPPSVLRAAQPLLDAPPAQPSAAPEVASRLASSINNSGVFYEAQVGRWFRGELPLAQLQRAPQMQLAAQARGVPLEAAASTSTAASSSPAGPTAAQVAAQAAAADTTARVEGGLARERVVAPAAMEEGLQNIVRHQLELLVNPVLRWEGDVWSGLFMALVVQLPEALHQREQQTEEGEQQGAPEEQGWRSELTLRHAALGDIKAQLNLQETRLALTLSAAAETVVPRLEAGVERLRERLQAACGVAEVLIQVRALPAQEPEHE